MLFLSIPGLRVRDVRADLAPTLYELANRGLITELTPTFPCVTSCVQASMWTGAPPSRHGIIANGFFHRDRGEVEFWVGRNGLIQRPQVWDALGQRGITSAVWHAQNIKDAAADFLVTPAPIHEPDGTTKLWCYSKPDGLYQQMLDAGLEHFPLQHYWGPLSGIQSTRWILNGVLWLHRLHRPQFHWVYLPHLDYAGQKFGPNSPQAAAAVRELDGELAAFVGAIREFAGAVDFIVAGEYAMTEVSGVIYPNRILRQAGWLTVREEHGREFLDTRSTPAFAMVDHQLAHLYVNDVARAAGKGGHSPAEDLAALFYGMQGIAGVYAGARRAEIGMDHSRAGDVILVAEDTHWFAYYWWLDDAAAPPFAQTVDIHNKPGYDPVELFFDPVARAIPLTPGLVKGSHGVPAAGPQHRTALIASPARPVPRDCRDTDLHPLIMDAFS